MSSVNHHEIRAQSISWRDKTQRSRKEDDVGLEREKEIKIRLEKRLFGIDEVASCLDLVCSLSPNNFHFC